MADITVRKLDHEGREAWRYSGVVQDRGPTWVRLEAPFNHTDRDLGYVVFRQGDRFVEWHYTDRYYNIFEVHDVDDDHLKGWYCNFAHPASITADSIESIDLALDLWIDPAGKILLLDEGDFAALRIDPTTREQVMQALDEVRARVEHREPPFGLIGSSQS